MSDSSSPEQKVPIPPKKDLKANTQAVLGKREKPEQVTPLAKPGKIEVSDNIIMNDIGKSNPKKNFSKYKGKTIKWKEKRRRKKQVHS